MHAGNKMTHEEKQDSFMKLYEPVHTKLNTYVRSIIRNHNDAKDIVSETVLKAYESFDKIRKPESFMFYLFKIASNLVNQKIRRRKFWGLLDERSSERIPDEASDTVSKNEMKEFYAALNRLPQKQREAIVMFEISGLSLIEIQQIQGGSVSGVKSRIGRARQDLERMLEYGKDISIHASFELK